jgi:hypothetical protein
MASFNKIWLGSEDTDPTNPDNWLEISLRNPTYRWIQSPAQANEFYVELAGGGDPGFNAAPGRVLINNSEAEQGTLGSLASGEWDYGDNDTLGFSTVYVRIDSDPDSQVRDYIQFRQIPQASDKVTLSSSAQRGLTGADWLSVAIADFFIEPGFRNLPIGDREKPLRIDPDVLISEGSGNQAWYIDIGSAAITPEIRNCPSPGNGLYGMHLTGSAMTGIVHDAGYLAVASLTGDTSTAATIVVRGGQARLLMGAGLTWTTLRAFAGIITARSNGTTINATGGQIETQLAMTVGALNIQGATVIDKSTGTFTTVNLDAGVYDTMQLPAAKTVSTLKFNSGTFKENTDLLTVTTRSEPDYAGETIRRRTAA